MQKKLQIHRAANDMEAIGSNETEEMRDRHQRGEGQTASEDIEEAMLQAS